jgi:hypothetical protein
LLLFYNHIDRRKTQIEWIDLLGGRNSQREFKKWQQYVARGGRSRVSRRKIVNMITSTGLKQTAVGKGYMLHVEW